MVLNCRIIEHGSKEQAQSLELRREILRKPLGLDFTEKDLAEEEKQVHIACFCGDQLAGILLLVKKSDLTLKMRQVAVSKTMQGKGVGKAMVDFAEQWGAVNGFGSMVLNARSTAVPFYLKLGYSIQSDEFHEVGIPHSRMEKAL